jgi:hypothetical protein
MQHSKQPVVHSAATVQRKVQHLLLAFGVAEQWDLVHVLEKRGSRTGVSI